MRILSLKHTTVTCIFILAILLTAPNPSTAFDTSSLTTIYQKLDLGTICLNAGFNKCKFVLVNNKEINAFAKGDGNIYINVGLLRDIQSEDELAFIIAHEMGHNVYRHPQSRKQVNQLTDIANMIGQLISKGNTKMIIDAVATATKASYSRPQEEQADIYAIKTIFDAGYNPIKAAYFFRRCLNRYYSSIAPWNAKKVEFENALYQAGNDLNQKTANVNQLTIYVNQSQQIYNSTRSASAYNQLVKYTNAYNAYAVERNNAVNSYNLRVNKYKNFMIQYMKVQNPLFRDHPMDEQRINYIVNMTKDLVKQQNQ